MAEKKKDTLPEGVGRDLDSSPETRSEVHGKVVSGSSNREGGYDIHPHQGDHGVAQKRGSKDPADYYGTK